MSDGSGLLILPSALLRVSCVLEQPVLIFLSQVPWEQDNSTLPSALEPSVVIVKVTVCLGKPSPFVPEGGSPSNGASEQDSD